ncbi:MAG: glycosyltransferase N-terminal domain-containing protein [Myxococcota bacterium]
MLGRVLYAVMATVAALLAVPVLWLRPKTRGGLGARLGRPAVPPTLPAGPRLWVHAASAGDVKNIWPVVAALKTQQPELSVVLTVITDSGQTMAGKMTPAPDVVTFLPLDAPPFVSAAMARIRPDALLLECTELWPTLIAAASRRGIPIILCNGRVSERSARRYRAFFRLVDNPVSRLTRLCLQTEEDRARYVALGADASRCMVTGNCKFDAAARAPDPARLAALRADLGEPAGFLVAGSTHQGEEPVILSAFRRAREVDGGIRLLWAPRYLEHAESITRMCEQAGWRTARRSGGADACPGVDVVVLDTMGELAAAYALARVAIVGGSFVERGGQNILEPAAQGAPVLHGPHMFLAPDQTAALDGVGATQVTAEELPEAVAKWLIEADEARRVGQAGKERVASMAGAVARHMEVVGPVVAALTR